MGRAGTGESAAVHGELLWSPPVGARSQLTIFREWVCTRARVRLDDYPQLHRWSIENIDRFWLALWDYFEVGDRSSCATAHDDGSMPDVSWFAGTTVNFAEQMLRCWEDDPEAVALVAGDERGQVRTVSWRQLRDDVAAFGAYLLSVGVRAGDHVGAYVSNTSESVVAFLGCVAIGAVWSSSSPDFGLRSAVGRFGEFQPRVLIATDGYLFGGRDYDRREVVDAILAACPRIETVIHMDSPAWAESESRSDDGSGGKRGGGPFATPSVRFADALQVGRELPFEYAATAFSDPLLAAFSSGTTGKPKGIVHGHGGVTLEAYKMSILHGDMRPADVYGFYTTTGWMVWFMVIAGLCSGATLALYDGNPQADGGQALWRFAADAKVTVLGASSAFFAARMTARDRPNEQFDLSAVRNVVFGAAPAAPPVMCWARDSIGNRAQVSTASGGTEIFTCFFGYCPDVPSYAGEFQCTWLGTDAVALGLDGEVVEGEVGDLVIRQPMPTMPIAFLNDPDRVRLRSAYFEDYPGIWRHGDLFISLPDGTSKILGRSDATLNRGGVRIGTAEIYDVVERDPAVADALVVNLEQPQGGSIMVMLLGPATPGAIDDAALDRIRASLRRDASPRHVPDRMSVVSAIPYTLTGKKLEVPIKRVLMGVDPSQAIQWDAIRNPDAVQEVLARCAELLGSGGDIIA